ncbi:MAG TPA: hypothetical protein VHJ18_09980 [Streptosporangiaceae bacterium]|nr:hypothetical protein [Streptosporangiaceae bacterium]
MGDDQLEGDRFAAAGFAADEHVALGEVDVDVVAGFVGAEVDRLPDRQGCHGNAAARHDRSPPWGVVVRS